MSQERVMLLIDADNVSVDVMEQAVKLLLNQHGALHVRRAYCTAESAVKHQAIFKRLSIKPMVNLAAGKNSTDIALAVDAIDLVLAERPDVVVIASSDSDFAPLVARLREKGCVVRGIGQQGKTGAETQDAYDDFTVLEHHAASGAPAPARSTARRAPAKAPAAKKAAAKKAGTKTAAAKAPAAKKAPARKTAARKSAAVAEPQVERPDDARAPAPEARPAPAQDPAPAEPVAVPSESGHRGSASAAAVLACLPELAAGQALALNVAVQRLREAQLLGRNSSSLKLFSQLNDRFELLPPDKPAQVRLKR
ncbi:MAG: NYN domain-containing protein [Burkholderiales bacterium]|nr:NYN domain-containing protein [Burkholderiales bacterium]